MFCVLFQGHLVNECLVKKKKDSQHIILSCPDGITITVYIEHGMGNLLLSVPDIYKTKAINGLFGQYVNVAVVPVWSPKLTFNYNLKHATENKIAHKLLDLVFSLNKCVKKEKNIKQLVKLFLMDHVQNGINLFALSRIWNFAWWK